jgi:hypothetical protein
VVIAYAEDRAVVRAGYPLRARACRHAARHRNHHSAHCRRDGADVIGLRANVTSHPSLSHDKPRASYDRLRTSHDWMIGRGEAVMLRKPTGVLRKIGAAGLPDGCAAVLERAVVILWRCSATATLLRACHCAHAAARLAGLTRLTHSVPMAARGQGISATSSNATPLRRRRAVMVSLQA